MTMVRVDSYGIQRPVLRIPASKRIEDESFVRQLFRISVHVDRERFRRNPIH
jgi:hypothetical protein